MLSVGSQIIVKSAFQMSYPAWMMKGSFDLREDYISFLYRGPRMKLLDILKGKVKTSHQFY